jgi:membrane-bound metal-dependent hydrolase YbcI (DUF457 family)
VFIGHGLLAFVVVALLAWRMDVAPRRALALGAIAALFGTLPDIDVVYGLVGLAGGVSGPGAVLGTFFETGNVVHRGPTHSLVVGAIAAGAFGLVCHRDHRLRTAGLAMLAGVVALVGATGTSLDTAVTLLFAVAGVGIVALARRLAIGPLGVAATAAAGLLSHPFGDLMTGEPPALLFPFDVSLFESHVALHPDPTVHLLAAFAIELTIVWLAFLTYLRLGDRDPWAAIDKRAIAGIGYGGAAVVIPAPTLSAADPFVFSVLAVGAIGVAPLPARYRTAVPRAIGTGIAAVTLAALAYGVVYVVL